MTDDESRENSRREIRISDEISPIPKSGKRFTEFAKKESQLKAEVVIFFKLFCELLISGLLGNDLGIVG